jgi:hypothetical protein
MVWVPNFPVPEFFHSFRGRKGDLTAFQKTKLLQMGIRGLKRIFILS